MDWFTSDLHLGHRNIIKYCNRPFSSVQEMDDHLINQINTLVKPQDVLYILGDFSMGSPAQVKWYRKRIKCNHIHLILGNHDRYKVDEAKEVFESISHMKFVKSCGHEFVLCHYALRTWPKKHYSVALIHGGDRKDLATYLLGWCEKLVNFVLGTSSSLYGHSHSTLPDDPFSSSHDAGVDGNNFQPLSTPQILAILSSKQVQ